MRKISILFVLVLILLVGCKSKEVRVQEQLDLGSKYMAELDYESAIVALNKAIKIDPKNVNAYKMLAEVYEKSGRLDDARATLEKVLDLDNLSSDNEDEINDRIKNLDFLVAISKLPGEYDEPTALELSNIGSNDIFYSIDTKDSRLLATDMKYTSLILLDEDGSYIVKAYTVDSSGNKHDSTEVKYTIKLSKEHLEKDSWESIGNIYRYRGKDGKIVTGWQQIDGSWYYFKENGDMATGVANINGVKYCFDEDGVMLTGWQQINGKWYYLGDDGIAKSGSQSIDGKQYYFGEDGAMLTGWQQIAGKWYYFGDDGIAKSGSQSIDGKQYYFGDDGAMLTGWQQINGKWYYILDNGELSTGWKEIDGKWYYFASNGEMKTDQYIDGYYVGVDGVRTDIVKEPVPPSKKYTDQFGIGDSGLSQYRYNGLNLANIVSNGPVIDRGNFYEVQNTVFSTYNRNLIDAGDYFPAFTTTIYIRKNAMVGLYTGDGYPSTLEYKTAEQCYRELGGKFCRLYSSRDEVLGIDCVTALEIDENGYFTKLNDIDFHVG